MTVGLAILIVITVATIVTAVVARRRGWLGHYESIEDGLSPTARVDAARSRSNAGMPF